MTSLMTALINCVYASAATHDFTTADLTARLEQSRANNQRQDVTGMLLYTPGSFFQVLEGDPAAVAAIFARVAKDPRHTRITVIIEEPIAQWTFGAWSMGAATMTAQELREVSGTNDFFGDASVLQQMGNGRVKRL